MPGYDVHEYDVLVVGAGGAGLRAAIEASAAGVSVGVVTQSLLGKAHTVMAEGGMAAAIGNVDDRDTWRVHFADTMRGGADGLTPYVALPRPPNRAPAGGLPCGPRHPRRPPSALLPPGETWYNPSA